MSDNDGKLLLRVLDDCDEVGVLCWDARGVLSAVSQGFSKLTGIARVRKGDDIDALWEALRACCESDPGDLQNVLARSDPLDVRIAKQAGGPSPCLRIRCYELADINIRAMLVRDVSERMQAEQPLQKREQYLSSLLQAAPIGIGAVRERRFLCANPRFCKMLGYSEAELLGQNARMVYCSTQEYERVGAEKYAMLRESGLGELETRFRRKDGSQIDVCLRSAWLDPQDPQAGATFTVLDISESKRQANALRESEQRARALLAAMPDLMFRLDRNGVYLDYKAERRDLYEKEQPSLIGLRVRDISPPEFAALIHAKIDKTLSSGDMQIFEFQLEIPGRGVRDWEARMTPSGSDEVIATVRDMTEQKASAVRLHTLSRIVEQSPDALLLTDERFRVTYLNPAFERLYGWPLSDLRGETPDRINAQTDAEEYQRDLYRRIESGESVTGLALHRRKDGSLFQCEYWMSPLYNEDGSLLGYMGAQWDVSARVNAERELIASEARYRLLAENSTDMISTHNVDGDYLYVSPSCKALLGYEPEELLGQSAYAFFHPDDRAAIEKSHQTVLAEKAVYRVEYRFRAKNGDYIWFETNSHVIRDPQGDAELRLLAQSRDVTDRKRAELAIRQSEEKYRILFEQIPQGVVLHDAAGDMIDANPAAQKILGRSREDFLESSLRASTWRCIHEDGRDFRNHDFPIIKSLRTGKPTLASVMGVFNPQKQDFVWISVDAMPLLNPGEQRPYRFFSTFTDITESREWRRALIQSQKMEAVGRLTGGIAHDFNNILGSVIGFTELAKIHNADRDKKLARYLEQIDTAGLRARDLVRQLLIYSRGERTEKVVATPVTPIVKETIKLLRPTFPATIEFHLELPEVSPSVSIDPLHLQQMLMNLCINARDAMPDGGRLSLSLRALQCSGLKCVLCHSTISGEWLELSVADTGCGVPEAQFDQIFQPFVTSKGVGEGSGMGLAVLAGLLRTYGAHVLLDSTVGQGSRFRLLLRPHAEANMQAENPAQNDYALANIHGARILIVDDEQPLREFYTETLTREGAQVVARQEASAALEALFAAPRSFDLILSDLGMPGMDGLALAESIRAANLDLPVLICSGSDESITPEALARLDIAGVLIKPVNSGPLLRAIDEALGKASD